MNKKSINITIFLLPISLLITCFALGKSHYSIIPSIVLYCISLVIIYNNCGKGVLFPPAIIFSVFYTVYLFVGSVILNYFNDILRYYGDINASPMLVSFAFFMFALGTLVANIALRHKPKVDMKKFVKKRVVDPYAGIPLGLSIAGILLISFPLVFHMLVKYGLPLLSKTPSMSYVELAKSSASMMPALTIFLPMVSIFLMSKEDKGTVWEKRLAFFLIILIVACMLMLSTRYMLFDFFLWFFFIFNYRKNTMKPLSMVKIMLLSFVFLLFFLGMFIARNKIPLHEAFNEDNRDFIVKTNVNRVFMQYSCGLNYILDTFPTTFEYFKGRSYAEELRANVPGIKSRFIFGRWLFNNTRRGFVTEKQLIGYLPPSFLGEAFANFGYFSLGVMFLWGVVLQASFVFFIRKKVRSLGSIMLFGFLSGIMARSCIVGFTYTVSTTGFITVVFIIFFEIPRLILPAPKKEFTNLNYS